MKDPIYTHSDGCVLSLGASDGERSSVMLVNMSGEKREVELLFDGEIESVKIFDEAHIGNFDVFITGSKLELGAHAISLITVK